MKKRFLLVVCLIISLVCVLSSCTPNTTSTGTKYDVAFIGNVFSAEDKSLDYSIWNSVKSYATANNLTYRYYSDAVTVDAQETTSSNKIEVAKSKSATVMVISGEKYENNYKDKKNDLADINVIFVGSKNIVEADLAAKTVVVNFNDYKYGYLYGYMAVKGGYTEIGYIGDGTTTSSQIYSGLLLGADKAASETNSNVSVKYLENTANAEAGKLDALYNDSKIYFASNYDLFCNASKVAAEKQKAVMGLDVDTTSDKSVAFSIIKNVGDTVTSLIKKAKDGSLPNKTVVEVTENPFTFVASSAFTQFTGEDFTKLYASLEGAAFTDSTSFASENVSIG